MGLCGKTATATRFKIDQADVSLRLYLRGKKEIPDQIVLDLRAAKEESKKKKS